MSEQQGQCWVTHISPKFQQTDNPLFKTIYKEDTSISGSLAPVTPFPGPFVYRLAPFQDPSLQYLLHLCQLWSQTEIHLTRKPQNFHLMYQIRWRSGKSFTHKYGRLLRSTKYRPSTEDQTKHWWKQIKMMFQGEDCQALQAHLNNNTITPWGPMHPYPCPRCHSNLY